MLCSKRNVSEWKNDHESKEKMASSDAFIEVSSVRGHEISISLPSSSVLYEKKGKKGWWEIEASLIVPHNAPVNALSMTLRRSVEGSLIFSLVCDARKKVAGESTRRLK